MKKQKQYWTIDEYGFVQTPDGWFALSKMDMLRKEEDLKLIIHVSFTVLTHTFGKRIDRDGVYKLLIKAKILRAKMENKHHAEHHKMSANILESQNRAIKMMGKGCGK